MITHVCISIALLCQTYELRRKIIYTDTETRISLNWPLNAQTDGAFFGRQVFHHDLYAKPPRTVNDDVWAFNSQGSSQWDGLRHFGYQQEKVFYNGVTMEDIHGGEVRVLGEDSGGGGQEQAKKKSTVNGIQGEQDMVFPTS